MKPIASQEDLPEFSYELKIPKERIAVLIGKKGEVKKDLEQETKSKIKIDSDEGDVVIRGKDSLGLYTAREVIHAIGRGFNPDVAKLLLKPDYSFELVDVSDYADTKNSMIRLRGRVIGEDGKARRIIEQLTETNICVFGKTVGIIGEIANVSIAKRAIESLLQGSMHAGIYRDLEKKRSDLKLKKMEESFNLKE